MGARLCDIYAIYAEPLASTRERMSQFHAQAAAFGRTPGFNVSVRPIIAASEGEAWDKANRILATMTGDNSKKGWSRQEAASGPVDNAGRRLMRFALESEPCYCQYAGAEQHDSARFRSECQLFACQRQSTVGAVDERQLDRSWRVHVDLSNHVGAIWIAWPSGAGLQPASEVNWTIDE